jgi:HEXXH motif-containing protein
MYQEDLMLISPAGPQTTDLFVKNTPKFATSGRKSRLDVRRSVLKQNRYHDPVDEVGRSSRRVSRAKRRCPSSHQIGGPVIGQRWHGLVECVNRHGVAQAPKIVAPRDLTLPARGSTTVRALLSSALSVAMSHALAVLARSEASALVPVFQREPGLLARSMRAPSRLVLSRCLTFDGAAPTDERETWRRELVALLCLDAAETGRLPGRISIEAFVDRRSGATSLTSLGRDVVWRFEGATRLTFEPGAPARVCVSTTDSQRTIDLDETSESERRSYEQPMWEDIPGGWKLALADNNPLADLEAHPDKSGSLIDLGEQPVEQWASAMGEAFVLIERFMPEIADEMRLLLGAVVPVGYDEHRHLSASYLEAIGLVYLTLHPNVMTLVEALIHEFQHNKLNLLLGLDVLLENGELPLFSSPVRPDPRPLRGVLLAVHAFHPIIAMYERMIADGGDRVPVVWIRRRIGEVARVCREGCDVLLPNAKPTVIGRVLLDEIAALDQRFAEYLPAT